MLKKMELCFVLVLLVVYYEIQASEDSVHMFRREFGDIGDEVYTNLPVKKSYIPNEPGYEIKKMENKTPLNSKNLNKEKDEKTILRRAYVHHFNPLYYRDFVTVKSSVPTKPVNQKSSSLQSMKINNLKRNSMFKPLNPRELHGLRYLKGIIDPAANNEIFKKSLITRRHYRNLKVKARKRYFLNKRIQNIKQKPKLLFNPIMKRAFYKTPVYNRAVKADGRSYINSRPGLLPYGFHVRPHSRIKQQFSSVFLQDKKNILKSWRNNLYRRNPLQEIDRRRKFHEYHQNVDNSTNKTSDLVKQSHKYFENSLLKDLSKVTMKWTGLKDSATINSTVLPPWFSTLKKVIEPKGTKSKVKSKKLMAAPIEKQRLNAAGPAKKEKLKTMMNLIYPLQKAKTSPQTVDASTETNVQSPINKNNSTANKKQLALYQGLSISSSSPSSLYQPSYYPTQPYYQTPPQQQPGLNMVPWNYYHSEYLPDGRIRPALYPIVKHILYGRCLPENSLCDLGHDEQCCGSSSFCVNYWGLNKCVAYNHVTENHLYNPYQIANDQRYKNYYNYFLNNVKGERSFKK